MPSPLFLPDDAPRISTRARVVAIGNFDGVHLGHQAVIAQRAGDLALLEALGAELGFAVTVHGLAGDDRGPFSSTRVRDALGVGDVAEARRVLGRFHAIAGVVGHGAKLGRTLGYPTANLQ